MMELNLLLHFSLSMRIRRSWTIYFAMGSYFKGYFHIFTQFSVFLFFFCMFSACSVSATIATGEACMCSEDMCTDAEFCYDGTCNTNPQGNLSFHILILMLTW